ncbi:MAG: NAD-dependent epimerase/dehydratase family protein, partial [Bacteroidia bacterium]
MNILLAGGTGFLGNALIQSLTKAEHTVTVLSRSEKASNNRFVSYRKWDGKQMPLEIGFYDVVINLVGASIAAAKWTPEYKQELLESR